MRFVSCLVPFLWILTSGAFELLAQENGSTAKHQAQGSLSVKQKYGIKLVTDFDMPTPNVVLSPDGKYFAGRDRTSFIIWETSSGKEIKRIKADRTWYIRSIASDAKHLTFDSGGQIKRLTVATGDEETLLKYEGRFRGFLPDGKQFIASVDRVLEVRDTKTGRIINAIRVNVSENSLGASDISRDGKTVAINLRVKQTLKILRIETGEEQLELTGLLKYQSIAFSSSAKRIATSGSEKTLRVWDTKTGQLVHTTALPGIGTGISFSYDGKWLAVGANSRVFILEAASGREMSSWKTEQFASHDLAFNPDGTLLVSSGGSHIQVWELLTKNAGPMDKKHPENRQ